MPQRAHNQGAWNATFGWRVWYHLAKLHVCEVCKAFECFEVIRYTFKLMSITRTQQPNEVDELATKKAQISDRLTFHVFIAECMKRDMFSIGVRHKKSVDTSTSPLPRACADFDPNGRVTPKKMPLTARGVCDDASLTAGICTLAGHSNVWKRGESDTVNSKVRCAWQCFCACCDIGYFTPTIVHFYHENRFLSYQSTSKIVYVELKTESLVSGWRTADVQFRVNVEYIEA